MKTPLGSAREEIRAYEMEIARLREVLQRACMSRLKPQRGFESYMDTGPRRSTLPEVCREFILGP